MIDTQYYVILGIYRGFIIYQETAVIGQFLLFYYGRELHVCCDRFSVAVFSVDNSTHVRDWLVLCSLSTLVFASCNSNKSERCTFFYLFIQWQLILTRLLLHHSMLTIVLRKRNIHLCLSSDKMNEEVGIGRNTNSGRVLETGSVTHIARWSRINVSTTSRNIKPLLPTVSINDSNIRKPFIDLQAQYRTAYSREA